MAVEKVTLSSAMDSKHIESKQAGNINSFNTSFLFNTQTNFVPPSNVSKTALFETKPDTYGEKYLKTDYKKNIFGSAVIKNNDLSISTKNLQPPSEDSFGKETKAVQNPQSQGLSAVFNNFILKRFQTRETTLDKKVLSAFPNKEKLELALATNPRIAQLLDNAGIYDHKIEMKNLTDIKESHIMATAEFARSLAEKMDCPKEEIDDIVMAAMLHDIGKAFMPRDILAKPGKFTPDERQIINSHAEVGGEVLKSLGYSPKIVEMVKNHHNPYAFDKGSKILRTCDMASALREERYYKKPMPIDKTMTILADSKIDKDMLPAIQEVMKEAVQAA